MDSKENELFQKLLDEKFQALRETIRSEIGLIRAEVGGLRKDMEHGFATLRRQITEGLDDAAKERVIMMQKNHDQDDILKDHGARISKLERYWYVVLIAIPGAIGFIYLMIQLVKAIVDLTK